MAIASLEDVETAASLIADRCIAVWENEPAFADAAPSVPAILIKGGHGVGEPDAADDYLRMASGESVWLRGKRITNDNTHGTGCSLSSAIACGLARGFAVDVAVRDAKAYVAGGLGGRSELGAPARAPSTTCGSTAPRCPASDALLSSLLASLSP